MQQSPDDPLLGAVIGALLVTSVVTSLCLLVRRRKIGYTLAYEPRSPVPWGFGPAAIAFVVVLLTIWAAVTTGAPEPSPDNISPSTAVDNILGFLLFQGLISLAALAVVVAVSRPSPVDLGLPTGWRQMLHDVGVGAIACLASLAPVLGLMVLVQFLSGRLAEPSHHALIETVQRASDIGVLLLATLSAVVFAPLSEELIFRLLLQGWLEKWEDAQLAWRRTDAVELPEMEDALPATDGEAATLEKSLSVVQDSSMPVDEPPSVGVAELPYGWFPIIVSSTLFALAHVGYGPEPVPLFVLALILGFLYQRTHRIVPSVATHALFNLLQMVALWRMTTHSLN